MLVTRKFRVPIRYRQLAGGYYVEKFEKDINLSKNKWSLSAIVPQESTANSNLGCGTIITSGTVAEIRDFWLRYYYYQRYFYLRLESIVIF